jgi:hypothetical protein
VTYHDVDDVHAALADMGRDEGRDGTLAEVNVGVKGRRNDEAIDSGGGRRHGGWAGGEESSGGDDEFDRDSLGTRAIVG